MNRESARTIYEFGEFRLDPVLHLLLDAAGKPVPLPSRAFETEAVFPATSKLADREVGLDEGARSVSFRQKALLRHFRPDGIRELADETIDVRRIRSSAGAGPEKRVFFQ
jgi:hypothetical protein